MSQDRGIIARVHWRLDCYSRLQISTLYICVSSQEVRENRHKFYFRKDSATQQKLKNSKSTIDPDLNSQKDDPFR